MAFVMRLIACSSGPTPFDGQFLKEYDPERDGSDYRGMVMNTHLVTTLNPQDAMKFEHPGAAWDLWQLTCQRNPIRWDGKPNRPLSAFTISVEHEEP